MTPCIFCDIVAGKSPASIVFRDETSMAFMDIRPVTPGHLLVIPLQHATDLSELAPQGGAVMFTAAHRLAGTLRQSGLKVEGVNLFLADGKIAGQQVFHVHLHVIPRFEADGFGMRLPPTYGHLPSREELDGNAKLIRDRLATSP
jgi:histidine triad (HIT) family protein